MVLDGLVELPLHLVAVGRSPERRGRLSLAARIPLAQYALVSCE
jgi:hypothetical protein